MIRKMTEHDSSRVLKIYKSGLDSRNATFETVVPSWADWDLKHMKHSRYVYVEEEVIGWIALSPVSTRKPYRGVAEVSVYVDINATGKGVGTKLMEKAITSSEMHDIWTLCSSVFPENTATLKLHKKTGFRIIGKREKVAKLDGEWRDTILLERRSKVVGI